MGKKFKKALSLLLCICLAVTPILSSASASTASQKDRDIPQINVVGLVESTIYVDKDNPDPNDRYSVPEDFDFDAKNEYNEKTDGSWNDYISKLVKEYNELIDNPIIYVPSEPETQEPETEEENEEEAEKPVYSEKAWPPSMENDVMPAIKSMIPALMLYLVDNNLDRFAKNIIPSINKIFDKSSLDNSGEVKGNQGLDPDVQFPSQEYILARAKTDPIEFKYDWRIDPIENARLLDEFIEYVCNVTGSEKVNISAFSYGGIVTLTYFTLYGFDRVHSVVFNSTAIYGSRFAGDLFSGKVGISLDSLEQYMKFAISSDNDTEVLIEQLLRYFKNTNGIQHTLIDVINKAVHKLGPKIYSEGVLPFIASWLSIWSMVPDDQLDDAMKFVFNRNWAHSDVDRSGIKEKVVAYNETVRAKRDETLKKLNESDVNVYVISRYNFSSVLCVPSNMTMSDGVLDTWATSFGATCSEFNGRLSESDIHFIDDEYISPDRTINASTCLFPEQTWFIKDSVHSGASKPASLLIYALLYSKDQATVHTFKEYPRFLQYDVNTNKLTPDKGLYTTTLEKILYRLKDMLGAVVDVFSKTRKIK